jgi:Uma2 family endonuclease
MADGYDCVEVNAGVDLRLRDLPLHNRRPDVVLFRCLGPERERLRAEHALLVVEMVSPGSEVQDTTDKMGEYAGAGIPHYWIVRLDRTGVSIIERYRLDRAAMLYKHTGTFMKDEPGDDPHVSDPFPVVIEWSELRF